MIAAVLILHLQQTVWFRTKVRVGLLMKVWNTFWFFLSFFNESECMKMWVITSVIDSKERFKKECFRPWSLRAVHWHLPLMFAQLYTKKPLWHTERRSNAQFFCACAIPFVFCSLLSFHILIFLEKFECYYLIHSRKFPPLSSRNSGVSTLYYNHFSI